MKKRPKRRKPARQPQAILVGNSGRISRDTRLRQLHMTKKYKNFLAEQEREKNATISEMSKLVTQYNNVSGLMYSIEIENADNSNAGLLQELEEMRAKYRERLFLLKATFTDSIPETLNESLQEILNCRTKLNKHVQNAPSNVVGGEKRKSERSTKTNTKAKVHVVNHPQRTDMIKDHQKAATSSVSDVKSNGLSPVMTRNSWTAGGYKSQIFVRKSNSQLQAINIDLFSVGNNLYDVLTQELEEDVQKYNLMFGAKEVDKEKTLFEQEVYHGSTVDLIIPLFGGMERKTKKHKSGKRNRGNREKKLKSQKEPPPLEETSEKKEIPKPEREAEAWTDPEIQRWFEKTSKILEISIEEVPILKTLDVYDVTLLEKKEWKEMSPGWGNVLCNMWKEHQKTIADGAVEYHKEVSASSTRIVEEREDVKDSLSDPDNTRTSIVPPEKDNTRKSSRKIIFGKAEALDESQSPYLVDDFENGGVSVVPQVGSVITVTGVCSSTPFVRGNAATLFIRDDPQGAVSFYSNIKIVITGGEGNEIEINSLEENLSTNMHVGVKGRVEELDEKDNDVNNNGCKLLKFKLVIDSDDHALFSVQSKTQKLTRQHSQSFWPPDALSKDGNELKLQLKVGDCFVDNDSERVYLAANIVTTEEQRKIKVKVKEKEKEKTKIDQLLQYVVAFKNCFDGEIFVGVKENGEITGIELSSGEITKWCEEVSKAIGNLLPDANEGADICRNIQEANELFYRNRCFVCALPLCSDEGKKMCWIHVPKGEARVYFTKPSDVHAYERIGAENKRITNYKRLFYNLESLTNRRIEPVPEDDYDEEDDENDEEKNEVQEKYRIMSEVKHENQHHELKMIFGDNPINTIQQKYLGPHACGFLNSEGGSIFFGIEEDEQIKMGHVVGIVVFAEERKQLMDTTVKALKNFYPPVSRSQFQIKFHPVRVPPELIVKDKEEEKMYAMITGPSDEIGKKWPKVIQDIKKLGINSAVIPIRSQRFCVVATEHTFANESITELLEQFVQQNPKFRLLKISETMFNANISKNICVVELKVDRSPYPIHMVKVIDTHVFKNDRKKPLCVNDDDLSWEDLMDRFKDSSDEFNVDHFLEHVKNFDNAGNSYIMVTSPFDFSEDERDLYGLVIPKWTLTIDFDQHPKQPGHLHQLFQDLNDRYLPDRARFLKTPKDSQLDLNPDHAICWLAARGYEEDQNSLSELSHAKWNKTHRSDLQELLKEELKTNIRPNCLNIVVLWDKGHATLVQSLQTVLEDLISLNGDGSTVITFVCATPKARSDIDEKIIKPLQDDNWDTISNERVFVAPPYVLARFLSLKLPSPYRPEDDYQVPHKKYFRSGGYQIIPHVLPQQLRQNLAGRIDVMYMMKGRKPDEQKLNRERRDFFSGSTITNEGLHGNIAIRRTKMDELEKHFKTLSHDKKSQVSLIFVKVDRGAGSTTLCLQFLYEQHRNYPCAQLVEIKDGLVSHIDEINKKTKLPLVLFVDENIAHLQDFLDFKKEVERRNVNVIFILIEPAEVFLYEESLPERKVRGQQKTRTKSARDSFLYGPSPYKEVELRRGLDESEMEQLVKVLSELTKGKKKELLKFKENAQKGNKPRTFAEFSLLAFGSEFKGLKKYVKFRLNRADKRQRDVLAFLSLTHVFTDYFLPENTLTHFLDKRTVELEKEMDDKYLQELLSPRVEGSDSRRISFHEVAREILKQLSEISTTVNNEDDPYWNYIKDVSVKMAKHVLSKYITTKKMDRLTRKLFVTSEYESHKFSLLIRTMRFNNPDTARDTLKELVDVFSGKEEKQSSIRAHLRAHLAKYHMMLYEDFVEAKTLIEAAISEQGDDSLLHHIHGDIIRLYVVLLVRKLEKDDVETMETIVSYAMKSSECFELVRSKRPHMSHGYISDAMVRITVMQAGIQLMGGKNVSFVDFLIKRINEIKESDEKISLNSRYLLSLISDAYDYLDERVIDFEQREKWKETFLECIGDLNNLTRLCDKIEQERNCSSLIEYSTWLGEVLLQIQILHNALEIENKDLSPHEIEAKLKKLEEYGFHSKFGDRFMKFWIRYSRQRLTVPNLQEVKRRVNEWSSKMKRKRIATPQAEFYNFVVHVLIALKNPSDPQKMAMAEKLAKQQSKKYHKKDFVLPLEWLQPKNGRHIESIECLLHHDDLIKGTNISSTADKRKPIEAFLFEKNITQWEGTISAISSEWQGTITFHGRLPVRFVPQNAQPSMPSQGDTVKFCLSFDGYGLSAWRVMREAGSRPTDLSDMVSRGDDSSSEYSDEDVQEDFHVSPSLCSIDIPESEENQGLNEHEDHHEDGAASKKRSKPPWEYYNEQRKKGVVLSTNPKDGFGFIVNPNIKGTLFFHAAQLKVPVKDLEGNIVKDMLLGFKVEKLTEKTRAADIAVLTDEEDLRKSMLEKLKRKRSQSSPPTSVPSNEPDTRRQEGTVVKYDDRGFGFIRRDNDKSGNDIFFGRRSLLSRGQLPKVRDRVEFSVTKDAEDRLQATDILVQNKSISSSNWDGFIGAGIQEGFVNSTTDDGGTINNSKVTGPKKNLHFSNRDILNKSRKVCLTTKVHFEVRRRGGRCVAVKINVIDTPEEMTQAEGGEASFSSNDF